MGRNGTLCWNPLASAFLSTCMMICRLWSTFTLRRNSSRSASSTAPNYNTSIIWSSKSGHCLNRWRRSPAPRNTRNKSLTTNWRNSCSTHSLSRTPAATWWMGCSRKPNLVIERITNRRTRELKTRAKVKTCRLFETLADSSATLWIWCLGNARNSSMSKWKSSQTQILRQLHSESIRLN